MKRLGTLCPSSEPATHAQENGRPVCQIYPTTSPTNNRMDIYIVLTLSLTNSNCNMLPLVRGWQPLLLVACKPQNAKHECGKFIDRHGLHVNPYARAQIHARHDDFKALLQRPPVRHAGMQRRWRSWPLWNGDPRLDLVAVDTESMSLTCRLSIPTRRKRTPTATSFRDKLTRHRVGTQSATPLGNCFVPFVVRMEAHCRAATCFGARPCNTSVRHSRECYVACNWGRGNYTL